jgi:hypothetical protein
MGLKKVVLGMLAAAAAATSIEVPVATADDTGFATALHAVRREHGKLCLSDHWHYGSSGSQRSKRLAQRAAIRSWQNFTALEYGSDWARYSRAGSRKMKCSRSSAGWNCDVEARACRRR